jgi:hypothetical protein
MARSFVPTAAAVLFLVCSACTDSRPAAYPVRGLVFVQGQPAANASVVLHPLGDDPRLQRLRPNGWVASDGSFTLTTYTPEDGAPAGDYAVAIVWPAGNPAAPDPEDQVSGPDRLEGRYGDPATSELRASIRPGSNEPLVFELP